LEEKTLCPQCGQMTPTIFGACPNCGYAKEPRPLEPKQAATAPWSWDVPMVIWWGNVPVPTALLPIAAIVVVWIVAGWAWGLGAGALALFLLFILA
jgi:hypothetical protein